MNGSDTIYQVVRASDSRSAVLARASVDHMLKGSGVKAEDRTEVGERIGFKSKFPQDLGFSLCASTVSTVFR